MADRARPSVAAFAFFAFRRLVPLLAVTVLLLPIVAACGDDDAEDDPTDEAAGIVFLEIRVTEDGVEPSDVTLRVPDRMSVTVVNNSDNACAFDLGPYVHDLHVEAGGSGIIEFTVTEVDPQPERATMGCGEDDPRSGTVEIITITA